jgi:hypothetical protein
VETGLTSYPIPAILLPTWGCVISVENIDLENKVAVREALDQPAISLAHLPATARQRRFALAVAALQFVACGVAAPFAATPLPQIDSFIPVVLAMIFVADLITAVLLFNQTIG